MTNHEFLTEQEFDRRYLVKRTVARTFLRRAAETDDPRAAARLAIKARVILENLPRSKEKCRVMRCSDCGGNEIHTDVDYETHYERYVYTGKHTYCTKCKRADPTFVEQFCVHKGAL